MCPFETSASRLPAYRGRSPPTEASGGFPGGRNDGPAPQAVGALLSVPAPHEKRLESGRVTIHRPIKSSMSREERERAVHVLTQILVTHLRQTEELHGKLRDVRDAR